MTSPDEEPALEHSHDPDAIAARLADGPGVSYLRDWVLGGVDGAVTTFAIVAGVAGAALSPKVIIILGVANLIADGISMAAGNYLGVKAEADDRTRLLEMEHRHIAAVPDGEREEVRQIFAAKGFEGEALRSVVDFVTAEKDRWAQTMMEEEHGAARTQRSAWVSGLSTFAAFVLCGSVPLAPFLLGLETGALLSATIATMLAFFLVGALKSKWSTSPWWMSGAQTLLIGSLAAGAAYVIGMLLRGLAG